MIKLTHNEKEEKYNYFKSYMNSGSDSAATASEVDPNANIKSKNIATYRSELFKAEEKQLSLHIWYDYIKSQFGNRMATKFDLDWRSDIIYIHDLDGLCPYCVAFDLKPFIDNGTKIIGGTSRAPKHLSSFCGAYINLSYMIAAQFKGAIADVSMLTYFDYFARKDFGENYLDNHETEIKQQLQLLIYTINEPAATRGNQSIFYNTSIFDKYYWESLFKDRMMPDNTFSNYESVNKLQWYFMNWFNEERTKELLTFPVITCAYLIDEKTREPKDKDFIDKMSEQMSKGNSFFIYSSDSVDSLASCCRLKNSLNMDEGMEENTFSYTLGGTGLQSGSKKVITINFSRLGQTRTNLSKDDFKTKGGEYCINEIKTALKPLLRRVHEYLAAFNNILWDEYNAGLLQAYKAGFIDLDRQYLTIGVNSLLELAEWLGYEISNNDDYIDFLASILGFIKSENKVANKTYSDLTGHKVRYNTEFVPYESGGVRAAKKDKKDGLWVPRDCYNSYFYRVEDDSLSIFDKADLYCTKIMDSLDGGSAYHMNLAEIPNKGTWIKIINYMSKCGCSYWTYNVMSTCCEDCGYINKNTVDHCVKCGSKNISYATRVIGYLTKIKNWAKDRAIEGMKRFYAKVKK